MLIVEVQKTNWNEEPSGFVAIDDFIQVNSDQNCDILPAKANPTTPPESWNDCKYTTTYYQITAICLHYITRKSREH